MISTSLGNCISQEPRARGTPISTHEATADAKQPSEVSSGGTLGKGHTRASQAEKPYFSNAVETLPRKFPSLPLGRSET